MSDILSITYEVLKPRQSVIMCNKTPKLGGPKPPGCGMLTDSVGAEFGRSTNRKAWLHYDDSVALAGRQPTSLKRQGPEPVASSLTDPFSEQEQHAKCRGRDL